MEANHLPRQRSHGRVGDTQESGDWAIQAQTLWALQATGIGKAEAILGDLRTFQSSNYNLNHLYIFIFLI